MAGERLSALETTFVCLEAPGRPIHIGAVAVFESGRLVDQRGRARLDALRAHVRDRIRGLPRMRERLAGASLLDRPRWIDTPGFDVADHVHAVRAPAPGDEAALRQVAEEIHTDPLDPDRPPWDLHLVTGLAGDRVGLVQRIHHAILDGVGGVNLAAAILDIEPRSRPARPADGGRDEAPAPAAGPADGGRAEAPAPTGRPAPPATEVGERRPAGMRSLPGPWPALEALVSAARLPGAVIEGAAAFARSLATAADTGMTAPRTSLNVRPGPRRRLAWCRARLPAVRDAGRAVGATVNDVLLAAVAGGLRSLLLSRWEPVPHDLVLKALVPVSERDDGAQPFGNEVSGMFTPLPVGLGDPAQRLATVAAATRHLKAEDEARGFRAFLQAADLLPMPVVRAVARGVDRQPFVNLVVTNVPGPPIPLYLMGSRLLEAFPVVPLGANLSVGVAILSYIDSLAIGLTADADACPDVDVLASGIALELERLGAGPATVLAPAEARPPGGPPGRSPVAAR